jgi:hypothetical protein
MPRAVNAELSVDARTSIIIDYSALLQGVLTKYKSVSALALGHGVTVDMPARLWKSWNETGTVKTKPRSGPPTKWTPALNAKLESLIRKNRKWSCARLGNAISMSESAVLSQRKKLGYRPRKTIQRPMLKKKHMEDRIIYANEHKDDDHSKLYEVDLDESWKLSGGFDLPGYYKEGEKTPAVSVGRKRHPDKVMYLAVVGNAKGKGAKVAFIPCEEAWTLKKGDKRTGSKKGEKRQRNKNVNGTYYSELLDKALAATIKHPAFKKAKVIYAQDDNAPAHSDGQEVVQKVWEKYSKTKPKIQRQQQMPKSPDTNVCDMGIFRWIQHEVDVMEPEGRDGLCKACKKAWNKLSENHIANMFKKKNEVCQFILDCKGGNHYTGF